MRTIDRLPRRAFLGVELAGSVVRRVHPGSTGELAGLAPGDRLLSIDGAPVLEGLRRAGAEATLLFERDGVRLERRVAVRRRPELPGLCYEQVVADDGARLRTLVTRPPSARGAILYVQGISLDTIESDPAAEHLARAWHRAGLVTTRLEKRGIGDSDGDLPDFDREVRDVRAAVATLAREGLPVFVFGHSVGGMIAPLLEGVRGIVVFGTSALRWFDCIAASTRRQLELRAAHDPERAAAINRDVEAEVAREQEALRREPVAGRSPAYHAQLQAIDLAGAWSRVDVPVLVQHGAYDFVVSEDESRAVAELSRGELRSFDGTDHAMTRHASLEESLAHYGRGDPDLRVGEESASFVVRVC